VGGNFGGEWRIVKKDKKQELMQNHIVDYEEAKALRRLGFQWPTLAYYDVDGQLQNADSAELVLKDYNAPKPTRGRGARCYSAPTLSEVQEWLRCKRHLEVLVYRDSFFGEKVSYYCRITRLKDGLSRDTEAVKTYEKALAYGIRQAISLLKKK